MSFNQNDITLDNYEEFLILYMDQELNPDQVKMVDDFLTVHPHIRSELDMLMSTQLPMEHFSINKEDLMSASMKNNTVDEDLLLYLDEELPDDQKKLVDLELQNNKDYLQQYQLLLKTRLDPNENIVFPDKESLYHHTEKVVAFRIWIRIAAAVIVFAVLGFLYYNKPVETVIALTPPTHHPATTIQQDDNQNKASSVQILAGKPTNPILPAGKAVNNDRIQEDKQVAANHNHPVYPAQNKLSISASSDNQGTDNIKPARVSGIQASDLIAPSTASLSHEQQTLNNSPVTSALQDRTTNTIASTSLEPEGNDTKGSVKSFLRKATRLIEKRTGLDPTNDNGELLIGAVAVKL